MGHVRGQLEPARLAWAASLVVCAVVPALLGGTLVLRAIHEAAGFPLAQVVLVSALASAVVIAALARELAVVSRQPQVAPWAIGKSCLLAFGAGAASVGLPMLVMEAALADAVPSSNDGGWVPWLVLAGFLALLLGLVMATIDYGRPRHG